MNCPKCNISLKSSVYEGVQIDKCDRCNGTWLDDGEIVKIVETKEETFDPKLVRQTLALGFTGVPTKEQQTLVQCPKCQAAMVPINYDYSSGIILDRCPEGHGLWLDGGELEKVQITREQSDEEFEKSREDWLALAKSALSDKEGIADENRRRNMRPTKYLANCLIRKLIGR
ncbi:MAG: TFIIB-type zinc ribbon-containing protein [Planctomycetota bacterium]